MMKPMLFAALALLTGAVVAEEPFRIVVEDVPETGPAALPPVATAPVAAVPTASAVADPKLTDDEGPVVEDAAPEAGPQEPVANCPHRLRPPAGYDEEVLMLQIFLDRNNFSAGVIDGVWGNGSRKALAAWQAARGAEQTTWIDVPTYAEIATMAEPISRYTITAEDVALVTGPTPPTWAERARMKLMGYDTLGACIAERFHTSERTLRTLNPAIVTWPDDLAEGTVLNVPNVRMAALEKPEHIVIVLEECLLLGYVTDAGTGLPRLCLRFPCSIARQRANRPDKGSLKVVTMAPAPNYTYDPSNYGQDSSVGRMVVPPGPRNPVGSRWIGLSLPSYGIHGSPKPNTVGRPESRGCFRLTNWNVEKLFELVSVGTPVEIVATLQELDALVASMTPETESEADPKAAPEAAPAPAEKPIADPAVPAAAGKEPAHA